MVKSLLLVVLEALVLVEVEVTIGEDKVVAAELVVAQVQALWVLVVEV